MKKCMFSTSEASCQAESCRKTSTDNIGNTRSRILQGYCECAAHNPNHRIPDDGRNFVYASTSVPEMVQRTRDAIGPTHLTIDTIHHTVDFEEVDHELVG